MASRTPEEIAHELEVIDQAHAQNEAGRDSFIALAHTALFAASVSFVGEVAPLTSAIWKPALISGWTADVVGLLALTFSFGAARRFTEARRAAIYHAEAPIHRMPEILNGIALWSFPVSLLCLFSFVTANVVHANGRQAQPSAVAQPGGQRLNAPNPSTKQSFLRCDPSAEGAYADTAGTTAKKVSARSSALAVPRSTKVRHRRVSPHDGGGKKPEPSVPVDDRRTQPAQVCPHT